MNLSGHQSLPIRLGFPVIRVHKWFWNERIKRNPCIIRINALFGNFSFHLKTARFVTCASYLRVTNSSRIYYMYNREEGIILWKATYETMLLNKMLKSPKCYCIVFTTKAATAKWFTLLKWPSTHVFAGLVWLTIKSVYLVFVLVQIWFNSKYYESLPA